MFAKKSSPSDGSVVYGANVRVSQNLPSINEVMRAAMPESQVRVMTVGQTAILQGTVASPEDAAVAMNLALRELNPGVDFSKDGGRNWKWISKEGFHVCRIARVGQAR